jgi:hypothetical protein
MHGRTSMRGVPRYVIVAGRVRAVLSEVLPGAEDVTAAFLAARARSRGTARRIRLPGRPRSARLPAP